MFFHKYADIDFKWMSWTKTTGWIEYDELQKIRREAKKAKSKQE